MTGSSTVYKGPDTAWPGWGLPSNAFVDDQKVSGCPINPADDYEFWLVLNDVMAFNRVAVHTLDTAANHYPAMWDISVASSIPGVSSPPTYEQLKGFTGWTTPSQLKPSTALTSTYWTGGGYKWVSPTTQTFTAKYIRVRVNKVSTVNNPQVFVRYIELSHVTQ